MRFLHLGFLALAWACAHADGGIYVRGRLNHTKAHQAYLEAEWKSLTRHLEKFLSDPRRRADHVDSVFAYKYLGVMYAANPETHRQAEARFRNLLVLDPSVDTADFQNLYASPEVMALFRRLREEYPRHVDILVPPGGQLPAQGTDSAGSATGRAASNQDSGRRIGRKNWFLFGAAAAGAAVAGTLGVVLYVSVSGPPETSQTRVPVDL